MERAQGAEAGQGHLEAGVGLQGRMGTSNTFRDAATSTPACCAGVCFRRGMFGLAQTTRAICFAGGRA